MSEETKCGIPCPLLPHPEWGEPAICAKKRGHAGWHSNYDIPQGVSVNMSTPYLPLWWE